MTIEYGKDVLLKEVIIKYLPKVNEIMKQVSLTKLTIWTKFCCIQIVFKDIPQFKKKCHRRNGYFSKAEGDRLMYLISHSSDSLQAPKTDQRHER